MNASMFLIRIIYDGGVIEINCVVSGLPTFATFWACLGLNDIFHWYTQLEILMKSSFTWIIGKLISWATEK